jgi:hypothetical protein
VLPLTLAGISIRWADGYAYRFGLHYVDYNDSARTRYPKLSSKWYASYIRGKNLLDPLNQDIYSSEIETSDAVVDKLRYSFLGYDYYCYDDGTLYVVGDDDDEEDNEGVVACTWYHYISYASYHIPILARNICLGYL